MERYSVPGSQTSVPGIGRFNNASLGYQHIFNDRLSLQLRANAMKINMSHITGQAFSTAGRLTYRASDRVAFNVFGSYDIGNSYGMSTNSYGATMSLDMSERFGVEVGAQLLLRCHAWRLADGSRCDTLLSLREV